MRRAALICAVLAVLSSRYAEAAERVWRLGMLTLPGTAGASAVGSIMLPYLATRGFVEGHNLVVDRRVSTEDQMSALAQALVGDKPDVIIATSDWALQAARAATSTNSDCRRSNRCGPNTCHAELGRADDAWQGIGEATTAIETTKETWCEADVHRIAGEIALKSPKPDSTKAQAYFDRALAVARQQQAKSWELRAAMSMARLWRDQDKREEARDLLTPVYGWFTEGFDTSDLKQAKALLDELA